MAQFEARTVAYLPFEEAFQELAPELLGTLEKNGYQPHRVEDPNHWTDGVEDPTALLAVFGASNPEDDSDRDQESEWWPAIVEDSFVSVAFHYARLKEIPVVIVLISDALFSMKEVASRLGPMRDVSWGAKSAVSKSNLRLIRAETAEELRSLPSQVISAISGSEVAPATRIESISGASISDHVTATDSLGFRVYYEAVAAFLTNPETKGPLTLSIEGEWGSGKSSFMEMLRERLKRGGAKTVSFNAWRHDREEAMWAAFALKFVDDLSDPSNLGTEGKRLKSAWMRWKAAWKLMKSRFDWRGEWIDFARTLAGTALWIGLAAAIWVWGREVLIPDEASADLATIIWMLLGLGGTAGAARSIFTTARDTTQIVGNPFRFDLRKYVKSENYAERIGFVERFHRDFSKIVEAYAGSEKVFVFIDDLDRCEVPRAADLMQALNLMIGADSRLIFIIGMDRQKVAAGLAVKFKDILPYVNPINEGGGAEVKARAGAQFGYEFIEKFIQLPFRVPVPNENSLEEFLRSLGKTTPTRVQHSGRRRFWSRLTRRVLPESTGRKGDGAENSPDAEEAGGAAETAVSPAETSQRQWDVLALSVREDSDTVHSLVKLVANALDYNPRRLKQFINLFRLRAYVAYNTGLLNPEVDSERHQAITLEQLGKFVAIGLRWPILLMDLEADRNLLQRLSEYAEAVEFSGSYDSKDGAPETAVEQEWQKNTALLRLLASNADPRTGSEDEEKYRIYLEHTMTGLDVSKLLEISPHVTPPSSEGESEARSGSDRDQTAPPSKVRSEHYTEVLRPADKTQMSA